MNTPPPTSTDAAPEVDTGDIATVADEVDEVDVDDATPKRSIKSRTSLIVGLSLTAAAVLIVGGITTAVVVNNNATAAAEQAAAQAAASLSERYALAATTAETAAAQIPGLDAEIATLDAKIAEKIAAATKMNDNLTMLNGSKDWISQAQQDANIAFTNDLKALLTAPAETEPTDKNADAEASKGTDAKLMAMTAPTEGEPSEDAPVDNEVPPVTFVVEPAPKQLTEQQVADAEQIAADAEAHVAALTVTRDDRGEELAAFDTIMADALELMNGHKKVMIANYDGILAAYNLANTDVVNAYNAALNAAGVDANKAETLTFTTLNGFAEQIRAGVQAGKAVIDSHTATQAAVNGEGTYTDVNGNVVEIPSAYVNPSVVPYVPSGPTWTPPGGGTTPPGGGTTPPGGGTHPRWDLCASTGFYNNQACLNAIPATFGTDAFYTPGCSGFFYSGPHLVGWGGHIAAPPTSGVPWYAVVDGPGVSFYVC